MFDCHKQCPALILNASVHTSVNAARKSACATTIPIFYEASPPLNPEGAEAFTYSASARLLATR